MARWGDTKFETRTLTHDCPKRCKSPVTLVCQGSLRIADGTPTDICMLALRQDVELAVRRELFGKIFHVISGRGDRDS